MNHEERLSKSLFTRFLHIAWRIAGDIAHRVAERLGTAMPPPFDGLHAIGVDETSHRKGHTYLTVVVDHERHRVIWAHGGYGGDVFDLFFKALTPTGYGDGRVDRHVRGRSNAATGSHRQLDRPARQGPTPVVPGAPNACSDGFHIVSWTDRLRRRRHQEHGPEGRLYRSWQLKELLRTLLKHPLEQARGELRHWVFLASHSRMPEIVELAKKIRRRRPDILRTIELGYSSARLEAFDNRIKVTIRMAYGFHHVEQPHRPGHAPMRWTRHPTTTTHDLTHENSRSLGKYLRNERHGIGAGSGVSRAGCRGARSARRSPRRLR